MSSSLETEDEELSPLELIEGWVQYSSPPLTAPQSQKPSVSKSQVPKNVPDPEEEVKVVFNEVMESPLVKVISPEQNLLMALEVSTHTCYELCLTLTPFRVGVT